MQSDDKGMVSCPRQVVPDVYAATERFEGATHERHEAVEYPEAGCSDYPLSGALALAVHKQTPSVPRPPIVRVVPLDRHGLEIR